MITVFGTARLLCIFRVFKRLLTQLFTPIDKVEVNKERITWDFIKYLWSFEKKAKRKIQEFEALYPTVKIIKIKKWHIETKQVKGSLLENYTT